MSQGKVSSYFQNMKRAHGEEPEDAKRVKLESPPKPRIQPNVISRPIRPAEKSPQKSTGKAPATDAQEKPTEAREKSVPHSPARPQIPTSHPDTDEESAEFSVSDVDDDSVADGSFDEENILEFFNSASPQVLTELTNYTLEQAEAIVALRPFTSEDDFRARVRKAKGVSGNVWDVYEEVISGFQQVDQVLDDCETMGLELDAVIRVWHATDAAMAANIAKDERSHILHKAHASALTHCFLPPDANDNPDKYNHAYDDFLTEPPQGMSLDKPLKEYQLMGVNWLNLLHRKGVSCILADEMGLGKTAQVIALLTHFIDSGAQGPYLVVVPSSTLENWMREFAIFSPNLNVQMYYGSQAERAAIRREIRHNLDATDVVVASYNVASSSPDDRKFFAKKVDFAGAIFDEGHMLKNANSKKYQELMTISAQWRLLLTGTPLQNNLQELVSLLSFILPKQFRKASDALKSLFRVTSASNQTSFLSRTRVSRAKKLMAPFCLRRRKQQVLNDLPNKIEHLEWCTMTDLQRSLYRDVLRRSRSALQSSDPALLDTPSKSPAASSSQKPDAQIAKESSSVNVLMDLRKAANHPMLFRRLYKAATLKNIARDCLRELEFMDSDPDYILEDLKYMNDFEIHSLCAKHKSLNKYALSDNPWMRAAKVHALEPILRDSIAKGNRVLLFSQFNIMLSILEQVLRTLGIKHIKLTGQTPVNERQAIVDEFANDPSISVFLLTTRAGGLGLNLVAANTVIIYDQDFNPHADKQAEDRAYRIGQQRDVYVYRLLCKNSIEEDMRNIALNKLKLDDSVSADLASGEASAAYTDGDGDAQGFIESKMKSSLISSLQTKFDKEDDSPVHSDADDDDDVFS